MADTLHPDIEILQIVAQALGELREKVVFVGGATTTLYIDDPAAPRSVATEDVDCVVEISGLSSYHMLERQLRKKGFKQPVPEENAPICRWALGEIRVDMIPTDKKILGFSNRWYPDGIVNRESVKLPNQTVISILSLPFFVATKLEAFKDRAPKDIRFSHDLEDIFLVLSGNSRAESKLKSAPKDVLKFITLEFKRIVKEPLFDEALSGALVDRGEVTGRADQVKSLFLSFSK